MYFRIYIYIRAYAYNELACILPYTCIYIFIIIMYLYILYIYIYIIYILYIYIYIYIYCNAIVNKILMMHNIYFYREMPRELQKLLIHILQKLVVLKNESERGELNQFITRPLTAPSAGDAFKLMRQERKNDIDMLFESMSLHSLTLEEEGEGKVPFISDDQNGFYKQRITELEMSLLEMVCMSY